tara:strand:- start:12218 stop:13042 length:825 start_codon:yes stop_codon:yes gene_type:complete
VSKHCLLWFFLLAQTAYTHVSLFPQPNGQLGEVERLYLTNSSTYFQLFNNDFIGSTDKYLTNSTGGSYTYKSKWEFSLFRRLITPALSYDYGSPKLNQAYGVLSDDTTIGVATYIQLDAKLVLYPEINLIFSGNQNAKQLYNFVHKVVGSTLNYNLYGKEQTTITVSTGIKLIYEDQYWYGGCGVFSSPYMNDLYVIGGLRYSYQQLAFTGQYKLVDQLSSKFYGHEIKEERVEWQVGLGINWYLFYFRYTSSFLKNDPVGQYHIAPLNFHWNW